MMCFCCEAGSRLPQPWICPVEECPYSRDVKRARSAHLLREHNLLFRGRGRDPVPLSEAELAQWREALRRRNRGSHQRARENRRTLSSSEGGGDLVAASARATSPMVGAAVVPLILLQDEKWGEAVVDVDTLLDDLFERHAQTQEEGPPGQDAWLVVPWVPHLLLRCCCFLEAFPWRNSRNGCPNGEQMASLFARRRRLL